MTNFDPAWLREVLQNDVVEVNFTKNDGSERKMLCTLSPNQIPEEKLPKNSGKAKNDDVISVFDIEKSDWRSFRLDSVRSIVISLEKN